MGEQGAEWRHGGSARKKTQRLARKKNSKPARRKPRKTTSLCFTNNDNFSLFFARYPFWVFCAPPCTPATTPSPLLRWRRTSILSHAAFAGPSR